MREIGGYIELDTYTGNMLHDDGIKINCGRNALAYLIITKKIKKILMPKFMCDSCDRILKENNIEVRFYSIGIDFMPIDIIRKSDEWLYIVNYYGQLSNDYIKTLGEKVIVDNAQAYFNEPIKDVDTLYTCRKFFGVSDGAILYTDIVLEGISIDESYGRMNYLMGRFERSATEFYSEYVSNNKIFFNEPIKIMSKLTENLLHGIDYERVKKIRTENFSFLHKELKENNRLSLNIPKGAFMYPLYLDNGADIRKLLQEKNIFIPTLWPAVFDKCNILDLEYDMAKNILPLPVDQRYSFDDMKYIVGKIKNILD